MYSKIYDFCKVRNEGGVFKNKSDEPTPRVKFLLELLDSEGIEYNLDVFPVKGWLKDGTTGYNIELIGSSSKMVIAHHDINNPNIDNANDNSASVINAIMLKKLRPELNVVLTDGEEFGGLGSQRLSERINEGVWGQIDWVLNLELTGKGGKYFFIGDMPGKLTEHILSIFSCPVVRTPYNDSMTLRKNGIDSVVINPLPPCDEKTIVQWDEETFLDFKLLFNCHNERDSIDSISVDDMKEFVEEIVLKIVS